MEMSYFVIEIE